MGVSELRRLGFGVGAFRLRRLGFGVTRSRVGFGVEGRGL